MPSDISTIWSLLWDMYEKTKGTAWEWIVPFAVMAALCYLAVKFVCIPCGKGIKKLYDYIQKKRFASKQFYHKLSYMDPRDVYQAINRYIPTRFSRIDPSNNDEPTPEYIKTGKEQAPLLLEQFLQYEYSVKYGQKYYLCLGDCGMGKTTFLLNLYYQTSKLKQFHCVFIPLQLSDYLERIEKIENPANTILMLDALDENEKALADYKTFITELEKATADFCRIIITARTNFFENAAREQLGGNKKISSTSGKISSACKFYIMPFTDEDIKQYLKMCYPFRKRKQKQAWNILESNKNLSVRPMLLKFMDPLLKDGKQFDYDFQLYEYLFEKWIEREQGSLTEAEGKKLYEECLLVAKAIYYQWMKNGRIGIYPHELEDRNEISGLESVKLKGHALLNRTSDGMYKFSHKSYWEYLLAKLALSDVQFSNDLLIGNFDRAVGFLEEMIAYREAETEPKKPGEKVWYTRSGRLFTGYEASIGVANYLLKYKKPEDAEVIYKEILASGDCSEELRLFAMVKLARSYCQQLKYPLVGELLENLEALVEEDGFRKEWLYIYAELAWVYGAYGEEAHCKDGQNFVEKLIDFYEAQGVVNYGLLRCYESYCRCCMNEKQHFDCFNRMKQVVEESFTEEMSGTEEKYAGYLLRSAEYGKISWDKREEVLRRIAEQEIQFLDISEQLELHCQLAFDICGGNVVDVNFEAWNQKVHQSLEAAYEICRKVYPDTDAHNCTNPYSLLLWTCAASYLWCLAVQGMQTALGDVVYVALNYIAQSDSNGELEYIKTELLDCLADYYGVQLGFKKKEALLLEMLEKEQRAYWKANICMSLWDCYNKAGEEESKGQKYLKLAYDTIKGDPGLVLTEMHCTIVRRMLSDYQGACDKKQLFTQLLTLLPQVYGQNRSDMYDVRPKEDCYRILASMCEENMDIYDDTGEKAGTEDWFFSSACKDCYVGLLECKIDNTYLNGLYRACEVHEKLDSFVSILSEVVFELEGMTKEECILLEDFVKAHEDAFQPIEAETFCRMLKTKYGEYRRHGGRGFVFS